MNQTVQTALEYALIIPILLSAMFAASYVLGVPLSFFAAPIGG